MKTPRKAPRLNQDELYEYAVRVLAARTYSTEALRTKLRLRALSASDIDGAITRLKEVGYLDDSRFAESFARYKAEGAGFGRQRVLSDLRGQKISPKVAEKAVERVYEGKNEAELIDAFIERRLPSLPVGVAVDDTRLLARAYSRLRRAGFSSAGSLQALKRRAATPEQLGEPEEYAEEDNLS